MCGFSQETTDGDGPFHKSIAKFLSWSPVSKLLYMVVLIRLFLVPHISTAVWPHHLVEHGQCEVLPHQKMVL